MPATLAKRSLQLQLTPNGSPSGRRSSVSSPRGVRVAAASKAREEAVAATAKADALERALGSPRGSQLNMSPPLPRARSESWKAAAASRVQARQADREDRRQAEQELSGSTDHATCLKDRPKRQSRVLDERLKRAAQQPRPTPVPEGAHWSRVQAKARAARTLGGGFSAASARGSPPAQRLPAPYHQLSGNRKAAAEAAAAAAAAAREAASLAMVADLEVAEAAGAQAEVAEADISIYLGAEATDFEQSAGLATPAEGWPELVSPQPATEMSSEMSSYLSDGDDSIERAPTSPSPVGPTCMEV